MNRVSFLLARTLRQEAPIAALSAPLQSLMNDLAGKRVALVGNARSLTETQHGAAIDGADLVIRINRAPMPSALSHGTRTDWLALATSVGRHDLERIGPGRILWMSHKRKRLTWNIARSPGFYLHPRSDYQRLRDRLKAPPTTGLMMIDLCAKSDLAALDLYGFDFFQTLSLTGSRTADQVPHDFSSERAFVTALAEKDGRVTIVGR